MNKPKLQGAALAGIGSAILVVLCFSGALEGAKHYKSLPGLQTSLALGLALSNLLVLGLIAWAANRVTKLGRPAARKSCLLALAVGSAILALAAPLIPSLALAGLCFRQWFCPDIANPLLWAYLRAFTNLPVAPLVVAPLVTVAAYLLAANNAGGNGA